jgi:hypothetical protein
MQTFVREQNAGEILRNSLRIYRENFLVVWLAYLLPVSPGVAVAMFNRDGTSSPVVVLLMAALGLLTVVPITVTVSDICVGNRPSLRRAYQRAFGASTAHVLLAAFLLWLALVGGLICLIVPGILVMLWSQFMFISVVLERRAPLRALKRSKQLGKGSYLRNFAVAAIPIFMPTCVIGLLAGLTGYLFARVAGAEFVHEYASSAAGRIGFVLGLFAGPISSIAVVLLYYDMRVRKEAYDATRLAEDLSR